MKIMNYVLEYITQNFVLLLMVIGMMILTVFDVFLDDHILRRLRITLYLLGSLSVFDYVESLMSTFGAQEWAINLRILFSALCYSLRPLIVMMLVFIVYKKAHWLITIPAAVNMLLSFSAFFTDISYSINANNTFSRGPLGYTPYVVSLLYIAGLFFVSFRELSNRYVEEGVVVMFLAVGGSLAALLAFGDHSEVVNTTYGAEILLYYVYVYSQHTKHDTLTGLYNRQAFYNDIDSNPGSITGIISMDMNELKWMNDNSGHAAGDKALKTVSDCFMKPSDFRDKVYRVGGDEFMVICRGRTPAEVGELTEDMRNAVNETGYSCAFGFSVKGTPEEMIKEADEHMYTDKVIIKAAALANGTVLHFRD